MQLDEFERAVQSSYRKSLSEDSVARHREFSVAIEEQISKIEKSLHETARSEGNTSMRWVHLDQHESDELALFLVGTCPTEDGKITSRSYHPEINECLQDVDRKTVVDFSKAPSPSVQWGSEEDTTNRKSNGHRRTASAHAGIETWTIAINDDGQQTSSDSSAPQRPRRVPSFSGLLNYMETTTNFKWTRNGVRKLKSTDRHEECETESRPSSDLTRVRMPNIMSYTIYLFIQILLSNNSCHPLIGFVAIFSNRGLMPATREVKVVWIAMTVTINNSLAGMVPYTGSCKGLNIKCNMAALFVS